MFTFDKQYPIPGPWQGNPGSGTSGYYVLPLASGPSPIPLAAGRILIVKGNFAFYDTGGNGIGYTEFFFTVNGSPPTIPAAMAFLSNSTGMGLLPSLSINTDGDILFTWPLSAPPAHGDVLLTITELRLVGVK